jgi:GMP synthase-like glutamine amidotransferase
MGNGACPVQAFRSGSGYGVQFHPEVDGETFASWRLYADEAGQRSGIDLDQAAADVSSRESDLLATWRPVFHRWGGVVRGT